MRHGCNLETRFVAAVVAPWPVTSEPVAPWGPRERIKHPAPTTEVLPLMTKRILLALTLAASLGGAVLACNTPAATTTPISSTTGERPRKDWKWRW